MEVPVHIFRLGRIEISYVIEQRLSISRFDDDHNQ